MNPRDRRRAFGAYFGRSYFKSPPLINPSGLLGFAIPCLLVLLVLLAVVHPHFAVGAVLLPIPVMGDIEEQFKILQKDLQTFLAKAAEQQKATGTITEGLATKIAELQKQVDAIDVKLAERHAASTAPLDQLRKSLEENPSLQQLMRHKNGNVVIELTAQQSKQIWERKYTPVTESTVGVSTTGVMPIQRIPGIVPEARQRLFLRDVLTARPTNQLVVDFVKVTTAPVKASPQTEAQDKWENSVTFTAYSAQIRTIATWIAASKQILEDMDELYNYLTTMLPYEVDLDEETEMLSGDNTGNHLYGIIPQATNFDTSLNPMSPGWNRIDIVGRACQQIMVAKEIEPTFLICHPTDWWNIRLTKDAYGRYILGDPMLPFGAVVTGGQLRNAVNLFGLTPLPTTNITSGKFIVGSGNPLAVEIRDRLGMTVEISTQHSDFFVKNLIAIRAEKRVALVVKRGASFIYGTFNTSP